MNTKEIRATCIDGTKAYYDFLDKNDRGLQRIAVSAINKMPRGVFQIKIGGKLFDTEAIFFFIKTNNKKLNTSQIKIVSYDANAKTLVVRPDEDFLELLEGLEPKDLEIISDLKFLVERVRIWYEKNGGAIRQPKTKSILANKSDKITYFEDMPPSDNQKAAIKTIFENPFSYIWGAPGTGKTQGVLSYALLHYIQNGHKVAILGPTNNAIEQVLRGVISMTDKAKISRDKIIRLGNPSKAFADEYPEVCESRGMVKQLEDLEQQATIFEKVLLHKNYENLIAVLESGEAIFEELQDIKANLDAAVIVERKLLVQLNANKKKIARRHQQLIKINQSIKTIDRRTTLLGPKVARLFAKDKPRLIREKATLQQEHRAIEDEVDELEAANELLELDWQEALEDVEIQKELLAKKIGFIKEYFKQNGANSIVENLLSGRVELVAAAIQKIKKAYEENKNTLGALAENYSLLSTDTLQDHLAAIQKQQEALKEYSTEERLKSVAITAATLDGYIGRFMEQKLNVQHIFVDEAGYANIVKVLTLFNHNVPITLLGDHMQLPPVCEISDQTIGKDSSYHNAFVWGQSAIFSEGMFYKPKVEMLEDYIKNRDLLPKYMKKADLNQTYRFGANLAEVLNQYVYKNGFASAKPDGKTMLYFIAAPKPTTAKKKRQNEAEAQAIKELVWNLDTDDFVILTPYRNQLKLLGDLLPNARRAQKIITVHGSQGQEWDTVILSVVDTYDKWFTDTENKLSKGLNLINTAVSRAKQRLIIVADNRFWSRQKKQLLKGLLDVAEQWEVIPEED